jgi:hypothetical protein
MKAGDVVLTSVCVSGQLAMHVPPNLGNDLPPCQILYPFSILDYITCFGNDYNKRVSTRTFDSFEG